MRMQGVRAADEDRPWSPAPKRRWGRAAPLSDVKAPVDVTAPVTDDRQSPMAGDDPDHDGAEDSSALS
jgi:hypothetical protein